MSLSHFITFKLTVVSGCLKTEAKVLEIQGWELHVRKITPDKMTCLCESCYSGCLDLFCSSSSSDSTLKAGYVTILNNVSLSIISTTKMSDDAELLHCWALTYLCICRLKDRLSFILLSALHPEMKMTHSKPRTPSENVLLHISKYLTETRWLCL